jgi:hypothetical protein
MRLISTNKPPYQWLSLNWLRSRNRDGYGGLRVIDIELYVKEFMKNWREK